MSAQSLLSALAVEPFETVDQKRLLPLYIKTEANGEKIIMLSRTDTPLCLETVHLAGAFEAILMIFDTEAEAQISQKAFSMVMSEPMESKGIWRSGGCLLILSTGPASDGFHLLMENYSEKRECGDSIIAVHDLRKLRTTADIAFSFDLSHSAMRDMGRMRDGLHKDPVGASDALFALVEDDLADDTVLRFFQERISRLEGACVPVITVCALDIQERIEDECDDDDIEVDYWSSLQGSLNTSDIAAKLVGLKEMIINRAADISLGSVDEFAEIMHA